MKKATEDPEMTTKLGEQFIHDEESTLGTKYSESSKRSLGQKSKWNTALKVSIVVIGLATIGVASWGIAASVNSTDDIVSEFWDVYSDVEETAREAVVLLDNVSNVISSVRSSLDIVLQQRYLQGTMLMF